MPVTPKQALAHREMNASSRFQDICATIDELLCGPPTRELETMPAQPQWEYQFPRLRDAGAMRDAVRDTYVKAGWRVEINGLTLTFSHVRTS